MNSDSLAPKILRVAAVAAALIFASAGMPDAGARTAVTPRAVPQNIRVGSFNLRNVASDIGALSSTHRPWKDRRAAVVKEVLGERLDVLGVQEASQNPQLSRYLADPSAINQYGDLLAGLVSAGGTYALVNSVITNCVDPTSEFHCVKHDNGASHDTRILYNTATLRVVKSGSYEYAHQSGGVSDTRFMAWAIFETIATGKQFFYANTHLVVGHPDIQKAEWTELIARTKALDEGLPVVVTGDFQTNRWYQPAVSMVPAMRKAGFGDVLGERVKYPNLDRPRPLKMINLQVDSMNNFQRNLRTSGHWATRPHIGKNVDWIFASNNLVIPDWKVVVNFDPKTKTIRGIIPSDHNLVRATITLP